MEKAVPIRDAQEGNAEGKAGRHKRRLDLALHWTHDNMMQLAPAQVRGWAWTANNGVAVCLTRTRNTALESSIGGFSLGVMCQNGADLLYCSNAQFARVVTCSVR